MFPRVLLHKRNGHRHLPESKDLSPGEIIRLVHSDRQRSSKPTVDLLKFAKIVKSETPVALREEVAGQMGLPNPPLTEALARTHAAFARGELADVREALEALQARADLAARMVTRLAASARTRTSEAGFASERRLVSLNALAAETLSLLATRLEGGVSVASRLDPELPPIVANSRQLQQVLVALISYAGQAMAAAGKAGTITVETSHRGGVLRGEGIVRARVADDGPGIPERLLSRIFQPLSTPGPLALVSRIVAEHGGVIWAENLPGGGACFTLEFPAV